MKYIPKGPVDNKPSLVQIMAWHLFGAKPLSEPMMAWFGNAYMPLLASVGEFGVGFDYYSLMNINQTD